MGAKLQIFERVRERERSRESGVVVAIKWLRDMMDFDKVINEMDYQQVVHNLLTDKPDVSL